MTPHNEAKKEDIANIVIMPGDPLRAKYIAENFLENYTLVNSVRGMYAYTGYYKQKRLTVMAHGMGMPSVGIYSYELFKFYDVDTIIRIGSCGGYSKDLNLNNDNCHLVSASNELNDIICSTANDINVKIHKGNTVCTDCFDLYMTDVNKFLERIPKDFNPLGAEMEAFALFYNAKLLHKKAACLMSVVDSKFIDKIATTDERQTGLNNMIRLGLESALNL